MKKLNPKVDGYLKRTTQWQEELRKLRQILLGCGLTEELKWGKPCYTFQESNVVLMIGFKEYCSLLLPKGALLKDPKRILIKAGENTQAARQIRFTGLEEIVGLEASLKAYVREAVEAEKAGLEVTFKKISDFKMPEELKNKLEEMPKLKAAFEGLTPGRQRGYYMHVAAPKQAKTRESRVEKCIPLILKGKGLNDDYQAKRK